MIRFASRSACSPTGPITKLFCVCFSWTIFFLQVEFLCMPIDYLGLDWAIRMKPFASSRGNSQTGPVCKISSIYSLLTIVVAKNLLFTNFIWSMFSDFSTIVKLISRWFQISSLAKRFKIAFFNISFNSYFPS